MTLPMLLLMMMDTLSLDMDGHNENRTKGYLEEWELGFTPAAHRRNLMDSKRNYMPIDGLRRRSLTCDDGPGMERERAITNHHHRRQRNNNHSCLFLI